MHLPSLNLSTRARGLLALLLFLIAWLLGNVGLIAGFEREVKVPGAAIFVTACVLWWISYKISHSASGRGITLGIVALSVWTLNLVGGLLLHFHYWIADPFFWASTAIFLLLVTALVVSEVAPDAPKAASNPDKSRNRTSEVVLHFSAKRVYQARLSKGRRSAPRKFLG